MSDANREAFEAWYLKEYGNDPNAVAFRLHATSTWDAWQAARQSAPPQTPRMEMPRHPNDRTPRYPKCEAALKKVDDANGQGVSPYWAWAYREGWHAAIKSAPQTPAPQGEMPVPIPEAARDAFETFARRYDGAEPGSWASFVTGYRAGVLAARQSAPPQTPAPQGEDGPEQCQSCGQEVAVNCRSDMCPHRWRFDTGAQQATVTSMQHEYVGGRTYSTISPGLPVGTVLVAAPQGEMPELEKAVDKLIQQAWMLGDACCADQLDFADVFTHARGDSHISWLRDQVSEYKRAVMSAATPQGVRHEGGEGEQ